MRLWNKKKEITHKSLTPEFKDDDGRQYYSIPSVMAMPLERFGKAQEYLMFMNAGMTADEMKALLALLREEVDKTGGVGADWVKIGAIIHEMEQRANLVIHTELLYNFIAVHYIREDEPIEIYSEQIQGEKVEAFKKMVSRGGAYGFFSRLPILSHASKLMNLSEEEWTEYWNGSIREQRRLQSKIDYLKSLQKLGKEKKIPTAS